MLSLLRLLTGRRIFSLYEAYMDGITAPAEQNAEASTVSERIGGVCSTIRAMLFAATSIH